MSLRVSHTTINATDAYALSAFWAAVLRYAENPDNSNESGREECIATGDADARGWLWRVGGA